ncbi:hypothetical protein [Aurantiacibacter poecillastricola]|uniref:hypothetical protein n=1 Tax=Aurantiacibacter poecillastricola TaxID=3064385 RepID=UPI00273EFBDE|nr:hypothetical protein [Aurantiacibacter sp. 219JJ12-13]MDP5261899.1 hypothetical protein [Aurantiacibacter sp. 219JJ12-13]
MKKIIASTIAAGLIAGTTLTATAAPAIRDAANVAQGEELGEEGGGPVLLVLAAAAIAAGVVILVENEEDEDVPVSA